MKQSRREYLIACGAGMLSGLSGCFASESRSTPIKITELYINNLDDTSYKVDVLIQEKGDIIYWKTVSVDPRDGRHAGGAVLHDYPKKSGYYTVVAKRSGGSYVKLNIAKFESSCCKVVPQIDKKGQLDIIYSTGC